MAGLGKARVGVLIAVLAGVPPAGEADLMIAKHRNGPTTTVAVAHQLHYSRFADLAG